jgi:competence protein ComEC
MKKTQEKALRTIVSITVLVLVSMLGQFFVSGTGFDNETIAIWIFDVGQGDAIFIDAPNAQVLIDGGPSVEVVEKLTAVMPYWDRSIDLLINSHPHADHVTGLVHVLERYDVTQVWTSGQAYGTDIFDAFKDLSFQQAVVTGEVIDLGAGATLTVLWPELSFEDDRLENTHDANLTLLFKYGETTMLFTGDMEMEVEEQILAQLEHVDILKVGHHGSLTSTSPALLEATTPDYAVIQVGEDNSYGHPHPVILDRLKNYGINILRTDEDGDLRITTDGGEPSLMLFDL